MNAQTPDEAVLGIQPSAPPPRRFFTPLSCCLGCAGLLVLAVVVFVGAGYWLVGRMVADTPIAIDMPAIDDADTASARDKCAALSGGDVAEAEFSEPELNAILREMLTGAIAGELKVDPAECKGRVQITADDRIRLAVSVPTDPKEKKYLNIEFLGRIAVDNFQAGVTDVELTRVGSLTIPEWLVKGTWKQEGGKRTTQLFGRVENRLKSLTVKNGRVRIVLSEPPPAAPAPRD